MLFMNTHLRVTKRHLPYEITHLTLASAPCPNPTRAVTHVGTRLIYSGGIEGRVVLCGCLYTEMVFLTADNYPFA